MADEPRPDSGWEREGEPASPEERCTEERSPELSAPSAAGQLLWKSVGTSADAFQNKGNSGSHGESSLLV